MWFLYLLIMISIISAEYDCAEYYNSAIYQTSINWIFSICLCYTDIFIYLFTICDIYIYIYIYILGYSMSTQPIISIILCFSLSISYWLFLAKDICSILNKNLLVMVSFRWVKWVKKLIDIMWCIMFHLFKMQTRSERDIWCLDYW